MKSKLIFVAAFLLIMSTGIVTAVNLRDKSPTNPNLLKMPPVYKNDETLDTAAYTEEEKPEEEIKSTENSEHKNESAPEAVSIDFEATDKLVVLFETQLAAAIDNKDTTNLLPGCNLMDTFLKLREQLGIIIKAEHISQESHAPEFSIIYQFANNAELQTKYPNTYRLTQGAQLRQLFKEQDALQSDHKPVSTELNNEINALNTADNLSNSILRAKKLILKRYSICQQMLGKCVECNGKKFKLFTTCPNHHTYPVGHGMKKGQHVHSHHTGHAKGHSKQNHNDNTFNNDNDDNNSDEDYGYYPIN